MVSECKMYQYLLRLIHIPTFLVDFYFLNSIPTSVLLTGHWSIPISNALNLKLINVVQCVTELKFVGPPLFAPGIGKMLQNRLNLPKIVRPWTLRGCSQYPSNSSLSGYCTTSFARKKIGGTHFARLHWVENVTEALASVPLILNSSSNSLRGGGGGSGLSFWKNRFRVRSWRGRPGHVPTFEGSFWSIRAILPM